MSDKKRLSVKAGYCGDGSSSTQRCVLEQSDCAADELDRWRSSRQMYGAPYSGHGGYCLWSNSVKDIVGDAEFGACQNASGDKRCSFAADQCVEGENWVFPVADCSCDQVRVGACEAKDERIFCAVTEFGCDDAATWMDPMTVSAQAAIDCYLCMAETTVDLVAAPTNAPVTPKNSAEDSDNSLAVAIGGALGGVLLLTLISASFIISSRKRKVKADAAVSAPPTKTFETGTADTVSNLDEGEFQARNGENLA